MEYPDPLIPGRLIKRYKRFLSDIELADGSVVTAHCANPGSMMGLKEPGSKVWLSPARNPERKLRYTWEIVEADGNPVGINTSLPNGLAEEAIVAGRIAELTGYPELKREVKYGKNSRIDLLLSGDGKPDCYVEVKSVTLRRGDLAEFPDAVTARGAKHLVELSDVVASGNRAVMLYVAQRGDCQSFGIAGDIDPTYEAAFKAALTSGVEAICYACKVTPEAIELQAPLPISI